MKRSTRIQVAKGVKDTIRVLEILGVALGYLMSSKTAIGIGFGLLLINEITEFAPVRGVSALTQAFLGKVKPEGHLVKTLHKNLGGLVASAGNESHIVIPGKLEHRGYIADVRPGDFNDFRITVREVEPPLSFTTSAGRVREDFEAQIDAKLDALSD